MLLVEKTASLDETFSFLQNELSLFFTLFNFVSALPSCTNGLLIKRRAVRLVVVVVYTLMSAEQGNLLRQLLALFVLFVGTLLSLFILCAPSQLYSPSTTSDALN